jgi:hypothetical protein
MGSYKEMQIVINEDGVNNNGMRVVASAKWSYEIQGGTIKKNNTDSIIIIVFFFFEFVIRGCSRKSQQIKSFQN